MQSRTVQVEILKGFKGGIFIGAGRILGERDTQLLNGIMLVEREEGKVINIGMLMKALYADVVVV